MSLNLVDNDQGLMEVALEIETRRAQTRREIRDLLLAGKDSEALTLMRKHFGIDDDKKLHRAASRLNGRAGR